MVKFKKERQEYLEPGDDVDAAGGAVAPIDQQRDDPVCQLLLLVGLPTGIGHNVGWQARVSHSTFQSQHSHSTVTAQSQSQHSLVTSQRRMASKSQSQHSPVTAQSQHSHCTVQSQSSHSTVTE